MQLVAWERCLEIPADDCTIDTSSEDKEILQIETATHDIVEMLGRLTFGWDISASYSIVFILITFVIRAQRSVHPQVKFFIPTDSEELRWLDPRVEVLLLVRVRITDANQSSDLCVHTRIFVPGNQLF